jgi:hypothetical protein
MWVVNFVPGTKLTDDSPARHESSHIQWGVNLETLKTGIVFEGFRSSDSCETDQPGASSWLKTESRGIIIAGLQRN